MNTAITFSKVPGPAGGAWIVKCMVLAALIATGWMCGQLQASCIGVIVLFALVQGILPYLSVSGELGEDILRCHDEKLVLQQYGIELAERMDKLDTSGAGSLYKAIVAISHSRGRMSKAEAIDRPLDVAKEKWMERLIPIENAADQCPQLGLGGSLLGMGAAIESLTKGGGETGLFEAMSTMVVTTLVGLSLAIVLKGLYSNAKRAIDRHDAELRMILGLFYGEDEGSKPTMTTLIRPTLFLGRDSDAKEFRNDARW